MTELVVEQIFIQLNEVTEDICIKAMQNDWDDMEPLCSLQLDLIQQLFSEYVEYLDDEKLAHIKHVHDQVTHVMEQAKGVREGIFAELQKMKKASMVERQYNQNILLNTS